MSKPSNIHPSYKTARYGKELLVEHKFIPYTDATYLFHCADAIPKLARTVRPQNPIVECRDGKYRRRFGRGLRAFSEPDTLENRKV